MNMNLDESNRTGDETISLHIPKDSFVIERRELGKGTLGRVVIVTLKLGVAGSETSAKTAAKKLQADEVNVEPSALASWLDRETRIWSSCSHENIIKFIGYHIEEDLKTAYLFSPYMRNGDAQVHLAVTRSTVEERFAVLKDTLIGLHYLHNLKPPIVHGDLRAANVLINDNRRAVLTDFGLYTLLDHCRAEPTFPGLMRWFSPELVANGTKRTTKSDMWAWGGLTLEIMMGKPPFWGLFSVAAVKDAILNGQTPEPRPAPQDWPNGLLELVRKCWSQRPEDRPGVLTCIDILNITLSVTECLRGEELELPGGSFIASDRLQSEPNQTLREAGNHTTKIVKLSPTGALVVMKEIHLQELRSTSSRVKFFKRFAQNIAYLSSLKHENILDVIGYSAANGFQTVSLVTRHMASGNLMSYVGKEVDISSKYELARDFTDGLQYLHNMEPPVTHGNLTPLNVLINENGKAVLGDYGLEAIEGYRASATSLRASIRWSSPEVNIGTSASVKSDIWSWACVVFQLVTGNRPYSYIQAEDQIKAVMLIGQRGHLTPEAYLEPEDKPNILMQLLRRCWEFDFSRRPNVKECADIVNLMLSGDPGAYGEVEEQQSPDDDISRFITSISPQALCINGRFGDVFKGIHRTKGEVALKRLRIGGTGADEEVVRRFEREADTWRRLKHPHVLEFLGTYKPDAHLYFVSPFAKNGTLLEYAHVHPSINRVRLLCETSDAIDYLHRENVVHGDIKASNLLISDDGHILLCDFGLAKPTHAQTSTALKGAGTLRWQSPELWNNEPRTFASDVYAFSMTIVEVLTGLPPFFHLENEVAVIMAVFQRGERPAKIPMESNGVSYENAWKVAEACWPTMSEERISMSEAFRLLSADSSLLHK